MHTATADTPSGVTQVEIMGRMNPFDTEPEWCLPPDFWQRSEALTEYEAFPLGSIHSFPVRKCHTTALRVIGEGSAIGEKLEYCTGYARSEGYWTRHSWVVHRKDKVILEVTPNRFEEYFGVILTDIELEQFKEIIDYGG